MELEIKSVYKLIKPYGFTISNEKFHGITNDKCFRMNGITSRRIF